MPTRLETLNLAGAGFVVVAGPCAVETRESLREAAWSVRAAGAHALRGGCFKPRTSPYSFQGLAEPGLELLAEAGREVGLPVITEVMEPGQVERVGRAADVLQVGARNMQNYSLLRALGRQPKPVLIKRGFAATIEEWLLAAEYVREGGNRQIILCERGIRTFETATRNTLDLSAVALLKQRTRFPVWVDPSHATGVRGLVIPMALAAAAAGADGLLVDVHPNPEQARCDGPQALTPALFAQLMSALAPVLAALHRTLAIPRSPALEACP